MLPITLSDCPALRRKVEIVFPTKLGIYMYPWQGVIAINGERQVQPKKECENMYNPQ